MRIVKIEIQNFRGIQNLAWEPSPGFNCLIGPGDSCKTTILDAIEFALTPRSYYLSEDADFFNLDVDNSISITVSIAELPAEFKSDNRYGLYLRGWDREKGVLEDEPREGLEEVLSINVSVDRSLEPKWSIYNERLAKQGEDLPNLRFKDLKYIAPTRLGPYAEKHLGWGRFSILSKISENQTPVSEKLAEVVRSARESFRTANPTLFVDVVGRVESVGRNLAVPIRDSYRAELDAQSFSISSGGISLHDDRLPLRRLGTGSSRLIVSGLQNEAGNTNFALIDELEYGLEPHRILRLIKYLKDLASNKSKFSQVFMTTHSPVVVRELNVADLYAVRVERGQAHVRSISKRDADGDAQAHIRRSPEAFLARKIIVGEGRTEAGLLRGLDAIWSSAGEDSFAYQGCVVIDGTGNSASLQIAERLLDLGYDAIVLLDTDEKPSEKLLNAVRDKGGIVVEWPGDCSTEERIFLDVPWPVLKKLIEYAESITGGVWDRISDEYTKAGDGELLDRSLPESMDKLIFRKSVGLAAKGDSAKKKPGWFKNISAGERVAEIIEPSLKGIQEKPLATELTKIRQWVNASSAK